jgi:hypothetical protein
MIIWQISPRSPLFVDHLPSNIDVTLISRQVQGISKTGQPQVTIVPSIAPEEPRR